jgi:small subunit ribosomal protein S6|tara:strand:+ start:182 stop:517 length:336 start_codon:yes stop_codon:yes gene_type:complete
MNCYEHTIITKHDIPDSQNKKLIDKYEEIIKKNSGKIIKVENWGMRSFARKINNNRKGFYYHFKLEGMAKTIQELEKAENIDTKLVRFLTVKVKKHDLETVFFENKDIVEN